MIRGVFLLSIVLGSIVANGSGCWVTEIDREIFPVGSPDPRSQSGPYKEYMESDNGKLRGNVLFTQEEPARVYLSGNLPYTFKPTLIVLSCRTILHIMLGDKNASRLIAIVKIVPFLKEIATESSSCNINMAIELIQKFFASFPALSFLGDLNRLLSSSSLNMEVLKTEIESLNDQAIALGREYFNNLKEKEFLTSNVIPKELNFDSLLAVSPSIAAALRPHTHTERMLIYDHRDSGEWPRDKMIIYSRLAMCETCEPEIVKASKRKNTLVIAEQNYAGSNLRNDPTSTVKKIIVPRVRPFL